jgi:hypothetical protein
MSDAMPPVPPALPCSPERSPCTIVLHAPRLRPTVLHSGVPGQGHGSSGGRH